MPRCENCGGQTYVSCILCMRPMCEGCISYHEVGKVCGLCFDRLAQDDCNHQFIDDADGNRYCRKCDVDYTG